MTIWSLLKQFGGCGEHRGFFLVFPLCVTKIWVTFSQFSLKAASALQYGCCFRFFVYCCGLCTRMFLVPLGISGWWLIPTLLPWHCTFHSAVNLSIQWCLLSNLSTWLYIVLRVTADLGSSDPSTVSFFVCNHLLSILQCIMTIICLLKFDVLPTQIGHSNH